MHLFGVDLRAVVVALGLIGAGFEQSARRS